MATSPLPPPWDPYEVLGVSRSASKTEIKAAFREQSLQCHPDLNQNASEATKKSLEARFKVLNSAYSAITKSHGHRGGVASAQFYRAAKPKASNGILAGVLVGPLVMLGFYLSKNQEGASAARSGEMKTRPYGFWYPPHNPFLKDDLHPKTKERRW
jgi:hypothetical protein